MHTGLIDLKKLPGEPVYDFVKRQDELGSTEIACRIAVRRQYSMSLEEAISACAQEPGLRVREIQNEMVRYPSRTQYSRSIWVQKSFDISEEEALKLIEEASQ